VLLAFHLYSRRKSVGYRVAISGVFRSLECRAKLRRCLARRRVSEENVDANRMEDTAKKEAIKLLRQSAEASPAK
jgi:hypothetical protein